MAAVFRGKTTPAIKKFGGARALALCVRVGACVCVAARVRCVGCVWPLVCLGVRVWACVRVGCVCGRACLCVSECVEEGEGGGGDCGSLERAAAPQSSRWKTTSDNTQRTS